PGSGGGLLPDALWSGEYAGGGGGGHRSGLGDGLGGRLFLPIEAEGRGPAGAGGGTPAAGGTASGGALRRRAPASDRLEGGERGPFRHPGPIDPGQHPGGWTGYPPLPP